MADPPARDSYGKLCKNFGINPNQVLRPKKSDVWILMRQNLYHPVPVKNIGNMTLYDGPLGKVFGGTDEDLQFTPVKTNYPQSVKPTVVNSTAITVKAIVVEATYISNSK